MNLSIDPISNLKGVGPQRQKVLNAQGISSIHDLFILFSKKAPRSYNTYPNKEFRKGDNVTLIATVRTFGEKPIRRGRMFQVIVSDGSGLLTLNWFNGVRYVKGLFKVGEKLAINGKVEWYNGFSMTHPEFEKLEKDEDPIQTGKVIPIYPLTQELKSAGLDQRNFRKMLKRVLESEIEIQR